MTKSIPNITVSYCLYGDYARYSAGLFQSLDILHNNGFNVCVSIDDSAPIELIETLQNAGCQIIPYQHQSTSQGMFERIKVYNHLSDYDVIFVRDADSIIFAHEIQFMHEFINSKFKLHVIRSHPAHDMPVMGGLFGYKPEVSTYLENSLVKKIFNKLKERSRYGLDQTFLMFVYQKFFKDTMVHSTGNYIPNEHIVIDDQSNYASYCGKSLLDSTRNFDIFPKNILTNNLKLKLAVISIINCLT